MNQHKTIELTGHADWHWHWHNPPSYLRGFIHVPKSCFDNYWIRLEGTWKDFTVLYCAHLQLGHIPANFMFNSSVEQFQGKFNILQGLLTTTEPNNLSQRVSTFKLESTSSDMDQYSQVTYFAHLLATNFRYSNSNNIYRMES